MALRREPDSISEAIDRAEALVTRLNGLGLSSILLTILNLVFSAGTVVDWSFNGGEFTAEIFMFLLILNIAACMSIILQDQFRRRSDILSEYLLEYAELTSRDSRSGTAEYLRIKHLARDLAVSADIPIFAGKVGVLVLFLLNILILASVVMVLVFPQAQTNLL